MIETLKALGLAWLTISVGTMLFVIYITVLAHRERGHNDAMERGGITKWQIATAILLASVLFPLGWKWIMEGLKGDR